MLMNGLLYLHGTFIHQQLSSLSCFLEEFSRLLGGKVWGTKLPLLFQSTGHWQTGFLSAVFCIIYTTISSWVLCSNEPGSS